MMHFPSFSSKSKSCILGHVAQSSEVHKKEVATLDLKKKEDVLLTPTTVTRPTRAIYKPPPSQRQKYCFLKEKKRKNYHREKSKQRGEKITSQNWRPPATPVNPCCELSQSSPNGRWRYFFALYFHFCFDFQINSTFFPIPKRSFSCKKNLKHCDYLLNFPDRKISALSLRKWRYLSGSRIVTDKILYNCSLVLQSSLSARWKAVLSVDF